MSVSQAALRRTSHVAENLGMYLSCTERTVFKRNVDQCRDDNFRYLPDNKTNFRPENDFELILTVKLKLDIP